MRLAEFGRVTRNEREGVLHGLLRVRAFTQDDAHVYCTIDQVESEVGEICEAIDELYARFGFEDVQVELSTRPEKSLGSDELWEQAESMLKSALDSQGREYTINPGDGAFYGPKIDFHVTDALGRSWQLGTCQLDFQMPERFGLTYTDSEDEQERAGDDPPSPARIDGALRRNPDRALRGPVPAWLAPVQARIVPVSDRAPRVRPSDRRRSPVRVVPRVSVEERSESVGKKIRAAELGRFPFMLVVGDREMEAGEVSVRSHEEGELGSMSVEKFCMLLDS